MHAASLVAFGHLMVDNPASGGHPLDIAGADRPVVSGVCSGRLEDISNGFDPAMRVPRETRQVILRNVIRKIVGETGQTAIRDPTRGARLAFDGRLAWISRFTGRRDIGPPVLSGLRIPGA